MGGIGAITSLVGLGSQIAGLAGGGGGGGGGGSGGMTEQEAALARYMAKQQLFKSQADFGATNTGLSTMATQSAGGSRLAAALKGAQISDLNQGVQGAFAQKQAQAQGTQAGEAAAASQQNQNQGGFSGDTGSLGNEDTASLGAA